MTFKLEQIENKPIFVATFTQPYNSVEDAQGVDKALLAKLNKMDGKIYYIPDMRHVKIEFSDMMMGMQEAFKRGIKNVYTSPRVQILTVGNDELIRLATEAVSTQEQYSQIEIHLFSTVEEAIAKAEEMMAST